MRAIRVHEFGGPDALRLDHDAPDVHPGHGEARVRIEYAGVNFIDVYQRSGAYPLPLPFVPGNEGSGTVDEIGEGVTEVAPGDRVAFAMHTGSYGEHVVVPAWKLVPVPDAIDSATAAAVMLQGMTAHYLTHSTYPLHPGDIALIHAAAGGVGRLITQMAKRLGARVIATVSTEQKAEIARAAGADDIVFYTREDFRDAVRRITGGAGVNVVYDSVGRATFDGGLEVLRRRGMLVLFGQSSGAVEPLDPQRLARGGSLFLTRPTLADYAATREELLQRAGSLFQWLADDALRLHIHQTYPLSAAAEAHRELEARRTVGKSLIRI